jgi:hypothetical protein
MQLNTTRRGWLPWSLCIATIVWTVAQASPAHAVINCNSGVVFNSDAVLSDNYEQTVATATPCITLNNGANLDFNGKKLTCKGGYVGSCQVAVKATANGSFVTNATPLNKAITADSSSAWGFGVQDAQGVELLRIERAVVGISTTNGLAINHNAITLVDYCVIATLPSGLAVLSNTLCQPNMRDELSLGWGDRVGLQVSGVTFVSPGPLISQNLVTHANVGIIGVDRMRIEDNLIFELVGSSTTGVRIDSGDFQTGSHNLCCDVPDNDADDCDYSTELSGGFRLWP